MLLNSKSALFTMSIITILFLGLIVAEAFYVVPMFQSLFQNFETEIPSNTQFVISSYKYWIIFPLLPFFIAIQVFRKKEMSKSFSKYADWLSIRGFVFAWLLLAFTADALYEPLYSLQSNNK